MRFSQLFTDDRLRPASPAETVQSLLRDLLFPLEHSGTLARNEADSLAMEVAEGRLGRIVRISPHFAAVVLQHARAGDLTVALGISKHQLPIGPVDDSEIEAGTARGLLLLMTSQRPSTLRVQVLPAVSRALKDEESAQRLLAARTPTDIRKIRPLMDTEIHEHLVVEDVFQPVTYRVYPKTPITEVADLMIRRDMRAIPVVGESYELLGVVTTGDVMHHLLPRRNPGDTRNRSETEVVTARDAMTRSVMCVSEDQSLLEAAHVMLNKNIHHLPVTRDGEVVGFLTRDRILAAFLGQDCDEGRLSEVSAETGGTDDHQPLSPGPVESKTRG